MIRQDLHNRLHVVLVSAIAFTLPFSIQINSLLIILCSLNWLVAGNLKESIRQTLSQKLNAGLIVLYLLHVTSLFFSENSTEAQLMLERKLSLLVFPFVLLRPLTPAGFKTAAFSFIAGINAALGFCMVMAVKEYSSIANPDVFFYHTLTAPLKMHAVYAAAYAVFSIHLLLHFMKGETGRNKTVMALLLVFLLTCCLLLSSKMMLLLLVAGLIYWFFSERKNDEKKKAALFAVLLVTLVVSLFSVSRVRSRFSTEMASDITVVKQEQYSYDTPFTGTSLRLVIWKYCFRILREEKAWMQGTGTGDFQQQLDEQYQKAGMYTGNTELKDRGYLGYGPHNQYIEFLLTLGIPGLLVFLTVLFLQFKHALKQKDPIYLQFLVIVAMFCITESVLGTQKGIVFYLFFTMLLHYRNFSAKAVVI